jgi:hypothetical protein
VKCLWVYYCRAHYKAEILIWSNQKL